MTENPGLTMVVVRLSNLRLLRPAAVHAEHCLCFLGCEALEVESLGLVDSNVKLRDLGFAPAKKTSKP